MIHFNLRSTGRVETSPGSEYGCIPICEPHLREHLHLREIHRRRTRFSLATAKRLLCESFAALPTQLGSHRLVGISFLYMEDVQ